MAKFKFKLQSFLQLKEKLENQKKLDYGAAMTQLEEEKTKKNALETERLDAISAFREGITEKIDPENFKRYNYYLSAVKNRITEQEKVVVKAEKTADEKRLDLIEAMKERKTLETLRDKEHVEFVKEELKAEQKVVDEIVSYQYNNRES